MLWNSVLLQHFQKKFFSCFHHGPLLLFANLFLISSVYANTCGLLLFTLSLFLCTLSLQYSPSLPGWFLAVKSIKKQHLVEVRSMANPPAAVKLALESICLLLGESTTDWKQIRSIIMRENFIPTIVNFSAEEIR